jgi:hypothetical protein
MIELKKEIMKQSSASILSEQLSSEPDHEEEHQA